VARFPAFANWRVARGWVYAELGRADEARRELELLAAHDFTDLPRNTMWISAVWGLAEIAAAVGHTRHAARIYQLLEPSAGHCMVISGAVCAGSIARSLGLLATTLGRFSEAERHFDRALEQNERMRAAPCVARTRYEYSCMLIVRGAPRDRERARELLDQSLQIGRGLGMIDLVTKAERFALETFGANGRSAAALTSGAVSPSVPEVDSARDGVFRLEGDYWTIAYEGESLRLKDSTGLRLIAQLLRNPGRELHVVDLATAATGSAGEPPMANLSAAEMADSSLHTMGAGAADHLFDARAKAAYKRRLEDLQEDLREAKLFNDRGRIERAQSEIDFIARELARGVGLGGRHRKTATMAERARINVTRRIRAAIDKIGAQDPSLGRHLATTIKTGAFCSYDPDPRSSRGWRV
jgi:tetratricopeptide (TPR) repeat protein